MMIVNIVILMMIRVILTVMSPNDSNADK